MLFFRLSWKLVTCFATLCILCRCSVSHQKKDKNIIAAKIQVEYPLVNEKGQLMYLKDTVPVFQYKDRMFYQLPYTAINFDTSFSNELSRETLYQVFTFKPGDSTGLFYNFFENKYHKADSFKATVDTVLRNKTYKTDFSSIADSFKLVNTFLESGVLVEKYIYPEFISTEMIDTVAFYFTDQLRDLNYSFGPALEAKRNKKLIRVELINNEKYSDAYKIIMPQRRFLYEIVPVRGIMPEAISELILNYNGM